MAIIYISDVHSLEQLNDMIKYSSKAMANIDQHVIQHIYSVRETLGRQLHQIRMRLDEAEARLAQAERAESACHARQHRNADGDLVPSCSLEEHAAAKARMEAEKWRSKYHQAQQIFDECQQEIADYFSGGHEFIQNMCDQLAPKASHTLCDCVGKLQDILSTNVM